MIYTNDPTITAITEYEDKLEWSERTGLRKNQSVLGVAIRRFVVRIVTRMFIWMNW